jgi:hypothetical protein
VHVALALAGRAPPLESPCKKNQAAPPAVTIAPPRSRKSVIRMTVRAELT